MLKIREIPLDKSSMIPTREVAGAIHAPGSKKSTTISDPAPDDHPYLLGTPYFDLNFKKDTRQFIPVGQYRPALAIFQNTRDKSAMKARLRSEYRSIVKALFALDIKFRIVDLEKGDRYTGLWLRRRGCLSLQLPSDQVIHWQIFPRDMCVYMPKVNALLVHSNLFSIPSKKFNGCVIIKTKWGEGGRVLLSGDRMLLGCHPETRVQERKVISRLRDMGMKAAFIPHALFYGLSQRGNKAFLFHHSHIDLSASLIKGKDGGFHLIIDPYYQTGPLADPLSAKASLDLVRRNCAEIGVDVYVPRKPLRIPFATAMVQFEKGKVLTTGGDDELLETISDIVGSENIKTTDIPILQYPVFGGAGLHCLITENPLPILSD